MSDVYNTFYALIERLKTDGRPAAVERVHELMAQATSYVWGFQDAGGEVKDTERSSSFGFAYGIVAARFELNSNFMRPPIQDAWRSWQKTGDIRDWDGKQLDGPEV
jgi:hypothetical protein